MSNSALLEANPDALAIAEDLDQERQQGRVRGPLHGIPFLIKDAIASKDKMQTTAGSLALLGAIVPRDAFVVSQLRKAGAVLMGKATLSEWPDIRASNYSEGYSVRGGQTRSSYNFSVNPGGSSSGSAVGVSNNVCAFSLGAETDGSVINPAERNAIVGIKPTVGLVSRDGVVPETSHQDTVGTFGKTVKDAVLALDGIFGIDPRDNATSSQSGKTPKDDYVASLADKSALKGATFGIPWTSFWALADDEQQATLVGMVNTIKEAGAIILNGTEFANAEQIISPDGWDWDYGTKRGYSNESEFTYVKVDLYNELNVYLSQLQNTSIRTLEDVVKFNFDTVEEGGVAGTNPAFASGQDLFLASVATKGIQNETYHQALSFCQKATREDGIDAVFKQYNGTLDALLVPPDVGQTYQVAAQAGYPMITIPAGVHSLSKMPFGLALMGTAFSDATLIKYASAIEDLQKSLNSSYQRTMPTWENSDSKVIPVANQCVGC